MTFVLSLIGLAFTRRGRRLAPVAPAASAVFRLANILILIGRRPATGETFRLMTATLGTDGADFASGAPLTVGERLDLLILLFEGSPIRVRCDVTDVSASTHGCIGRLRFAPEPAQRAAMLSFLHKVGKPVVS